MSDGSPIMRAAEKVADTLRVDGPGPEDGIPGKPGPESPQVAEPTRPRDPLPRRLAAA